MNLNLQGIIENITKIGETFINVIIINLNIY